MLEVHDLVVPAHPGYQLNFSVGRGEIVGLAGLVGAGRTEVLQALFGIQPALSGVIRVDGRAVRVRRPIHAIRAGMALVPEDRKEQGLILEMSVRHNIGLAALAQHQLGAGFLNMTGSGRMPWR